MSNWGEVVREHRIHTSTLADVLDGFGHYGALTSRIGRLDGSVEHFAGQAYTISWGPVRKSRNIMEPLPSTWQQVKNFLVPELESGKGKVYVAGGGPLITEAALAGGLSSTYFEELGFEGLVLGGAIRDAEALQALKLPVVASNYIPTDTQGSFQVVETGTSCVIENVRISTGDWIVSDRDGTVVIPEQIFGEVVERALQFDQIEDKLIGRIRNKERLPDLIEEIGRI